MSEQTDNSVPPIPLAFLLCDQVVVDAQTGKKTLVGIFDRIIVGKCPAKHSPCTLFFRGGDCEGRLGISVKYLKSDTQELLAEAAAEAEVAKRGDLELTMMLPPIDIPSPGKYEFQLYINGRYIQRVRFTVTERTSKEAE